MKTSTLIALLSLLSASVLPAVAKPTPPSVCGAGDLSGVVVLDCTGYVSGNLFNAKPTNRQTVVDMLGDLGLAGQDGSWIEKLDALSGSPTFTFATPIYGLTYIGVHSGGGNFGQGSALYKLDAGYTGLTTLNFNLSGLSSATLYSTLPVPEPGAAVMMLAGLAVIGLVVRRRTAT